jgi:hypothetical protein
MTVNTYSQPNGRFGGDLDDDVSQPTARPIHRNVMTYSLADVPDEKETGGMSFSERYRNGNIRAIRTGEFREPKRGEWYLSGAIAQGYKAPNDLNTKYHILKLVKVETKTFTTETVVPL